MYWTSWSLRIPANVPPADGVLFFNMLDIAAYNALVLWITANLGSKSDVQRRLLQELGIQLVIGHMTIRSTLPEGKRRRIQDCVR